MAWNLAKQAKLETDALRKMVMMNILRHARIMELLPFDPASALKNVQVRWNSLPTVAFRAINGSYTANEGDYEQVYESVFGFGGELQFDRVFKKLKNVIVDPRVDQVLQKTTAMSLKFNDYFINGDLAVDPLGFEGLKKRVSNMPARMTVSASGTTDILDPTASAGNRAKFLDKWEEAAHRAGNGSVNAIFLNEALMLGYGRVLRNAGINGGPLYDTAKDMFEREVFTYKGAPMIDVGLKADQTTEIITLTEDPGDGGNDATSAYFCSFDEEQGIRGLQLDPLEVYDPLKGGEMSTAPAELIRCEWWVGLWSPGSYGFSRLKNVETPASWT